MRQLPDAPAEILVVDGRSRDAALDLLVRFFREEGFSTPAHRAGQNFDRMLADDACWAAIAVQEGQALGIVTATTMLYVEWGRLAEIGDLYVVPAQRRRGLARRLVNAVIDWGRQRGCSGVYVTVTPEGEARHRLSQVYQRLNSEHTGRSTMMLAHRS